MAWPWLFHVVYPSRYLTPRFWSRISCSAPKMPSITPRGQLLLSALYRRLQYKVFQVNSSSHLRKFSMHFFFYYFSTLSYFLTLYLKCNLVLLKPYFYCRFSLFVSRVPLSFCQKPTTCGCHELF